MLLELQTDAGLMNGVINHPGVRPDVADMGEGVLDLSATIADPRTVCLAGDHGGFLCFKYDAGIFEVHSAVIPSGRGKWAKEAAEEFVQFMFCQTDCIEILTRIPEGNVAAMALARSVGFRPQFVTPAECLFRGEKVSCAIWVLTLQEWSVRATDLSTLGQRFHQWMNQVFSGTPHGHDEDHDRIVGISLEMVRYGQVLKGVAFYNRWAIAARHAKVNIVSSSPVQIGFDAGILTVQNGEFSLEARH